jgi:hypothetical protein
VVNLITKISKAKAFLEVTMPLPEGLSWDQAIHERTNCARRIRERNSRTGTPRPTLFIFIKTTDGQPSGLVVYSSDIPTDDNIDLYRGASIFGVPGVRVMFDHIDVESRIKPLRSDLHAVPVGKKSYLATQGDPQPIFEFMVHDIEEVEQLLKYIYEPGKVIPMGIQPHVRRPHGTYKIKRPRHMKYPNRPRDPDFG